MTEGGERGFVRLNPARTVFAAILLFTLVTRLGWLDARRFHHDESVHAWMAGELARGQGYHYDPVYHGPLLYHLEAATFLVFGESETTARLVPASFGVLLVALCYLLLRRSLGEATGLVAAALVAISPSFTYYSRFNSHDVPIAVFTVVMISAPFEYLRTARRLDLLLAFGALALAICTKLNAYFIVATLALYAVLAVLRRRPTGGAIDFPRLWRAHRRDVGAGVALFVAIVVLLFATTFVYQLQLPRQPVLSAFGTTVRMAAWAGFEHWISIHNTPRLPGPFYYYVPLAAIYDPHVVLLALAAIAALALRRWRIEGRGELGCWVLAGVVQFVLYGIAGEKVPWLTLHVLLPWMVVGSAFLVDAWRAWPPARVPLASVVIALAGVALHGSWALNTRNRAEPAEPMLQVIFSADVERVVDTAVRLAATRPDQDLVRVESPVTWPFGWYLRNARAGYPVRLETNEHAVLLIAGEDGQPRVGVDERYDLRRLVYFRWSTWIDNVRRGDIAGLLRFALTHDQWGPVHQNQFRLYVRKDVTLDW
jgi:uncharacterized protein (TIGR03663 family)